MSGVSLKSIQEVIDSKGEYFIAKGKKGFKEVGMADFYLEKFKILLPCFFKSGASQRSLTKTLYKLVDSEVRTTTDSNERDENLLKRAQQVAQKVGIKNNLDSSIKATMQNAWVDKSKLTILGLLS